MKTVILSPDAKVSSPAHKRLLDELEVARKVNARLYRTHTTVEKQTFEIVTTIKDIHLKLGTLSAHGIGALCVLLTESCMEGNTSEILIQEEPDGGGGLLAIRVIDNQRVAFHISRVQGPGIHGGH